MLRASRTVALFRGRWLREIAAKLDPPSVRAENSRTDAARRQARVRQRRKKRVHVYKLDLADRCVEGLIEMMLSTGRLSEADALDHARIEAELARLLEEQGERWSR